MVKTLNKYCISLELQSVWQDHLCPVVSCQCPGPGLVAAPAAGPITSRDHVYISWPPQHLVTWSLQFRTHSQTSAIPDNMELPDLKLNNEEQRRKVLDFLSPLCIDESKCQKIISVFQNELDKGNILPKSHNCWLLFLKVWNMACLDQAYKWRTHSFQNF